VPLLAIIVLGGAGAGFAISRRTPTHVVPDLTGMTQANAQKSLLDDNFGLVADATEFNEAVPSGAIIRQTPLPGEVLKEKQTITVVLSKGLKPVDVPDLSGLPLETAIAKLEGAGLRSSNPPQFRVDETIEAGHIVGWNPRNAVAPDSLITLVVSSGPAAVPLPRVRGLKPDAAIKLLPPGVTSTRVEIFSDTKTGLVSGSEPKSGTLVRSGDVVKIFVSKGPELVTVPNVINLLPAQAAVVIRAAGLSIGNTNGPVDQPVLHTRPLRNTKAKRGTKVTFYTTEDNVPEVPGVAATRSPSTTGVARPLPVPSTTVAP
jgi:eukaryotic-like serine/threonine-protein kinase